MGEEKEATWPPRWDRPMFKEPVARKVTRGLKREAVVSAEQAIMRSARQRDRFCRFPECGCRKFKLRTDVCHQHHRGSGGNRTLSRTTEESLILLCSARHRENRISLDRKTLRVQPLTPEGMGGPCVWYVEAAAIELREAADWVEIGRETARHSFEPFTPVQERILKRLAEMTL